MKAAGVFKSAETAANVGLPFPLCALLRSMWSSAANAPMPPEIRM